MSIPAFAALETKLAAAVVANLANAVMVKSATQFKAVLERGINPLGEFDLSLTRQDRLTVDLANTPALAAGDTVSLDPAYYTSGELAAYAKTSWKLDRKDSDDGLIATWWLK